LLTLGGAICIFFGALALFQQPEPFMGVSLKFLFPVVGTVVFLMALLVYLITRAQLSHPHMGMEAFIGEVAEVIRPLQPDGKVFFNGTYWDAMLKEGSPPSNARQVRIVGFQNMKLIVEPLHENQQTKC
ncbi:MAG: NfeD family protein, partial [Candidatus Sumerlaeaceae bacterium]|nr:NfeD family protein [Candidatus Sumerlaeaceae bacterium]